jgi:hypothetical protein
LKTGKDLTLGDEICGKGEGAFEMVDRTVSAILVRKDSGSGAVRITGGGKGEAIFVVTGSKEGTGYDLVSIEDGQTAMLLGRASVRYFRRLS